MNFKLWYSRNQDAITWWLIGFLSYSFIDNIVHDRYILAGADVFFIYLNYRLSSMRIQ